MSTFDACDFLLQSASKTVVVGSHVWVEDSEIAWKDGEVEAVNGGKITVKCTSGDTVSISKSMIFKNCEQKIDQLLLEVRK